MPPRRKYDRIVSMRLTLADYNAIAEYARAHKAPMANVMRYAVMLYLHRPCVPYGNEPDLDNLSQLDIETDLLKDLRGDNA